MKYYLLIAGNDFAPQKGTKDWIDAFETFEEAKSKVNIALGFNCKDIIAINGNQYDWYEIVDLREWIEK